MKCVRIEIENDSFQQLEIGYDLHFIAFDLLLFVVRIISIACLLQMTSSVVNYSKTQKVTFEPFPTVCSLRFATS